MKFIGIFTKEFMLQSLVPVVAIFLSLFILIGVVSLRSGKDTAKVVTVHIPAATTDSADEASAEVQGFSGVVTVRAVSSGPYQAEIQAAQAHIENREWQSAEKIYRDILSRDKSAAILNEMGVLYVRRGDQIKALAMFNQAIDNPNPVAEAWFNRGILYSRSGDYVAAARDYREMIKIVPYHLEAHVNLGLALSKLNKYEEAIAILRKASQLSGGERKAKVLYSLGNAYRKAGSSYSAEATAAYRSAIRIRPSYALPRFGLAALQPDTKKGRQRALELYLEAVDLNPDYAQGYFHVAQQYSVLGNKIKAAEYYRDAVQKNPGYDKARYNLALIYLNMNRAGDARTQFEQIVQRNPDHAKANLQLGRLAYKDRDYDTAHRYYDAAQRSQGGKYPEAYLNKGLVYSRQKRYDLALEQMHLALKVRPNYASAYHNIGLIYARRKEEKKAEKAYLKALDLKQNYPSALFNLALLYARVGDTDKAVKYYEKAIAARPGYHKAMLNLGVLYAREQQYGKAAELYQRLLKQDDTYAKAWYNLGLAYMGENKSAEAVEALAKGVALEQDNRSMRVAYARALMGVKEYDESIRQYRLALGLDETDVRVRMDMARAMMRAERRAEAMTALNQGLALDPNNEQFKRQLEAWRDGEKDKVR